MKKRWEMEPSPLTETAEPLPNPDRGFYAIHPFRLEEEGDPAALVRESYAWDTEPGLSLVEVDLRSFRDGPITDQGLRQLEGLFRALGELDKRYILSFLYDLKGRNMATEPTHRGIIETHMGQVSHLLAGFAGSIFTLQGLFVGNWGEMNGTRYTGAKHWRALAETLDRAVPGALYLAVRTPAQRRACAGRGGGLDARLGLFNDGMMGSDTDLGTFSPPMVGGGGPDAPWCREEELAYIRQLCRKVPNGGEAVCPNPLNDFPRACEYLRQTRVTYLNRDHDVGVLKKWQAARVTEPGPWQGTDGFTYIREHLGYRFLAENARLGRNLLRGGLTAAVRVRNLGFAPVYRALVPELVLLDPAGKEVCRSPMGGGDLRSLAGGGDKDGLTLRGSLPLDAAARGEYSAALRVTVKEDGRPILLANRERSGGDVILGRLRAI
jgi:hypothetical protein